MREWKFTWFKDVRRVFWFLLVCVLLQSFGLCCSLNDEGKALLKFKQGIVSDPFDALSNWVDDGVWVDPCNWFGVECSNGRVVVLNLKDLCLEGKLANELESLFHIKSIVLRNNSFHGIIPEGIVRLKELEVLDLGYNNFSGPLMKDIGINISLTILLLDNNDLLCGLSHEITQLAMISESQVDENQLISAGKLPGCTRRSIKWCNRESKKSLRKLLQSSTPRGDPHNRAAIVPDSPSPSRSLSPSPSPSPSSSPSPSPSTSATPPKVKKPSSPDRNVSASPSALPAPQSKSTSSKKQHTPIVVGIVGGVAFIIMSIVVIYLWKTNKVATVKPWATGLSGQLQKAFVTGVPKLKRSELEAACEDFSNVIGTSPVGSIYTVYKGTLSSGVEIAVASVTVTSLKDWSKASEVQFRKKVDTLSKMNHKNFVNLLGFCEEDEPFTRMVVFEYAPNGTLFEHLHIKEAEHLDWATRLRVAIGTAYCLQHMHQLNPPLAHCNLNTSSVQLTDDYAAKISDLSFLKEIASPDIKSAAKKRTDATLASNIYSFGIMLLETVTGRLPYSNDQDGSLENWASQYLQGNQSLKELVDPTLVSFQEEQLVQIGALIKSCVNADQEQRPTIKQVCERLREITKISPDVAVPKLSPLWWAELEIASFDAS